MKKIFPSFRQSAAANRIAEQYVYEKVAQELEAGVRNNGLWLKALMLTDGDERKTEAEYIKLRVQSLVDEEVVADAIFQQQILEEEKNKKLNEQKEAAEKKKSDIAKSNAEYKEALEILHDLDYEVIGEDGFYTIKKNGKVIVSPVSRDRVIKLSKNPSSI